MNITTQSRKIWSGEVHGYVEHKVHKVKMKKWTPQLQNPKAQKAKDYIYHVLCCTELMLVCPVALGIRCADHVTPLYSQKLALISPTGGGRSVGIVRSRTKAKEFSLCPVAQ
jgi:hypothetical protein